MNKKEALEILNKKLMPCLKNSGWSIALQMAIDALVKNEGGKTERKIIYLDDAIEAVRCLPNAGMHWYVSTESVFDALLNLPPAQPECTDCIKNGGDWECDHVHCHKGECDKGD